MKYLNFTFSLSILFLLVCSCTQNRKQLPTTDKPSNKALAPQVVLLAHLPDSLQPKKIYLKDMPTPKAKRMAVPPKVHSFIDPITKAPLLAPEAQGLGHFTNFTSYQGLAMDGVICAAMDKMGNIWFGTLGGGVSRYDGKSFTNYTIKQGLASNQVYSILEDQRGNLWFGTSGGVSCYDGKNFTNYTTKQGLAHNEIQGEIIEDKAGNLWFGTYGGGISRFDGKNFTNYTTKEGLAHNQVSCIKQDKKGYIWVGTFGGVSRYDGRHFTNYTTKQGLAYNEVASFMEDKKGNLWFGTNGGGVSCFNGKGFINYTTVNGLANNEVLGIIQDNTGDIWFATFGGGISRFDGQNFVNFTTKQGLANNFVYGLLEDKTGNIWFCTLGGGISRYNGKSVINYTNAQGLAATNIYDIIEDKSANLWFGTSSSGVSRYDGKSFTNFTSKQGLANNIVYGVMEDETGNIWVGNAGNGGINCYHGKHFTNYTIKQGLVNNHIMYIIQDRKKDVWFGTIDGVSRFDGKSFINYTTKQGLTHNAVGSIMEDKTGNIWFGTLGGGVSRFDGKSFTNYTIKQGLADNIIYDIMEDEKGILWFGTDGGLSRFDGESFINYTTEQGLPDNSVAAILVDSDSSILIGTNGLGILTGFIPKAKGEKINEPVFAQNALRNEVLKNYTPKIEIYNISTGYPVKEVNGQALFKDSKGIIWIGTGSDKTGLVRFDYSAVRRNKIPPVVQLQGIKINNEAIGWQSLKVDSEERNAKSDSSSVAAHITEEATTFGKTLSEAERDSMRNKFGDIQFSNVRKWYPIPENLVLPYRHNNITFDFGAIELDRPYLVKYQYILEGYDAAWSPMSNKSFASFGNMSEGTYSFKVKAQSPFGVWSQPISYTFKVLPPWWRTWWAYTLYMLIFAGALRAYIVYRSRALRRENRILEEKVSLRTTQLEQKSTELEKSLEHLKTTQAQLIQKEKLASLGELTAGIAHEIQNPLNFVNNFSEVSSELVEEMQEELDKGDLDEAKAIADDIKQNLEKINLHGKRASNIVSGMLEHSRSSSGEQKLTDINKLADEYLRLAYHGMRAKDKSFNADYELITDENLPQINVVSQDIGRVLLNLINNAFQSPPPLNGGADYRKKVTVSTKLIVPSLGQSDDSVRGLAVIVSDNGSGIPAAILPKIFQPFFTTKPPGEGTGLGLSLSYDIVTKGHGGTLEVETKEGEGATFVVKLPL